MERYIEIITKFFKALWNKLDLSLGILVKAFMWVKAHPVYTAVAGLVGLAVYVFRYGLGRYKSESKKLSSVSKHLVVSSAKHLHSAISVMQKQPLLAYEHALQASIEGMTAKDITDDKSKFSKELGVDIYKYLEYVNGILTQLKQKLQ